MKIRKIPTLSLFSGAGGLDIGFDKAGYDILACVELEKKYCATLEANIKAGRHFSKRTKVFNQDITEFDESQFIDAGVECIIGGPPCQTFSAAGRRSGGVIGTEDIRGQLYEVYCRILDTLKPRAFVFENVYGLPGANGGGPWREIVEAFEEHGYSLTFEVVDTADYGVPQHRERLIMVGLKQGSYRFPMPTHGPDSNSSNPLVSVKAAINDLQDRREPFHDDLGGMYGHLLPGVPEGLNYSFYTAEMGHPEPVFAWRSKFHDLLYKVNPDQPCRTIKAQPGKFTGPFHWKNRHFTLPELKRLQTFPDDYELVGSYGVQLEQIGNSVPPKMAEAFAQSIREQVFDGSNDLEFEPRPENFKSTFRQRQRERSKSFKGIAKKAISKRYGKQPSEIGSSKESEVVFHTEYSSFFGRTISDGKHTPKFSGAKVTIRDRDSSISMDFASTSPGKKIGEMRISITGLSKYLPRYADFSASCSIKSITDVFHVWKEVEKALTARSKFFTLIDIYGHYANRGDVVDISTEIDVTGGNKVLLAAIQHFSQTRNCGEFVSKKALLEQLQIGESKVPALAEAIRALRFDFRTETTHPIIGRDRYLCTYPFPLLSPRALVESKVEFTTKSRIQEDSV
ncbi:DNA (cytosine-5-)-methyltransferase [Tropicimonas sp. TH_r6]|uniref:DNA cytosine methyltransferase n=1 Tax=Tropicimonas sp. TH_r6 TaxID=3082085 RepID=UPI0029541B54|nr:DNA (cytosine-5-)-methyltransferase [Tropicimonas sp. TH_r6]MDV7145998.1 DNA (cytosine-5-)-methyltransferase [Tropicimonas sp. TH_r6]